jgi:hypothetical protein
MRIRAAPARSPSSLALALAGVLAIVATPPAARQDRSSPAAAAAEFVGPFPSWTNVKTAYGAVGDGQADDTAALARAFASLSADHQPVLYLPAGTYRLTDTLTLQARQNVSVIGADPSSVTLVWDGAAGGTMVRVNGVAYSRLSRISFDGRSRASIAIDQSADDPHGFFDTGNEYADDEFRGVAFGIHGGFRGRGFAETSIVRDRFIGATQAGVALGNFNALDIWIRDSLFDHCAEGVTNEPGAGNFRVYDSVFRESAVADLMMQNTGLFTARGNYSSGSKAFFVSGRSINHPANIDIQRNVVIDTVDAAAVRLGNQGPGVLLDNVFRSRPGVAGPVIVWPTAYGASVASIGNTFTVANALGAAGSLLTIDDRVVAAAAMSPTEPALPPHPPMATRPIVEVAADADGAAIQDAIGRATARLGQQPVVHIPFGHHAVATTIEVPPGDLQIVGDGYPTVLTSTGRGVGPVMHVTGPTHATIRDLTIVGGAGADGLVADGIDQPNARVRLDRVELRAGVEGNLLVDRLRHAAVDLLDFGHAQSAHGASVRIAGAPGGTDASPPTARTVIYSGASSDNSLSYDLSGTTVIRDMWYEGRGAAAFARIHSGARVTVQGTRVATPADTGPPAITIDNAGGRTSLINLQIDDRIALATAGPGRVLGLGLLREFSRAPFVSGPTAGGQVVFALGRQRAERQGLLSPGTTLLPNIGETTPDFVRSMLADLRAFVSPASTPTPPTGSSDLRIERIWCSSSRINLTLRP